MSEPPASAPARRRRDIGAGRRAARILLRPRVRRVDLLVALLLAALGFAAAVQVRSTQVDGVLASARPDDLVRILDDLSGRNDRLRAEVSALTAARERLTSPDADTAALAEAQRRAQLLGVLTGTAAASGPGVLLTIDDPDGGVRAEALLDALEELRAAGAEALQLEGTGAAAARPQVRVVASTSLLDVDGGVLVDGTVLRPPYRYRVVGDTATLASAMGIPGGVVDTVSRLGGTATVEPVRRRPGDRRAWARRASLRSPGAGRLTARPRAAPPLRSPVYPDDLTYTAEHEWLRRSSGDGTVVRMGSRRTPRRRSATSSS